MRRRGGAQTQARRSGEPLARRAPSFGAKAMNIDRFVTDTQPSDKYKIVSRANAGEVMPDPCSPLNATLGMFEAGEKGWRDAYVVTGTFTSDEFEPDRTNTISCYGGYMFINMSLTALYGLPTGLMT